MNGFSLLIAAILLQLFLFPKRPTYLLYPDKIPTANWRQPIILENYNCFLIMVRTNFPCLKVHGRIEQYTIEAET